jgi:hypothetical protein
MSGFGVGAAWSLLKLLGAPIGAVLKWLFADWRNLMITVLALDLCNLAFRVAPRLRDEIAAVTKQRDAVRGTVANLREEARQAAIRQQANLQRVGAAHESINRENVSALQLEVAALRHRAELLSGRLRTGEGGAHPGSAAGAGLSGTVPARTGIAEASADQGFPAATGNTCPVASGAMSIQERLIASEQAYQLDRLIDAVVASSQVSTAP